MQEKRHHHLRITNKHMTVAAEHKLAMVIELPIERMTKLIIINKTAC